MDKLAEAKDGAGLIGQFGVGFYSAFMVADRIEVVSRRAGAKEAWAWTSSGGGGFEIAPASEEQAARVARGTEIVLHLKEDAKKYLEPHEIRRVVATYSDHILFPIELVDAEGKSEQINSASALWQRPKSELKPEEYAEAYRSIAHAFDEPAMTLHYRAEGRQSYAVLLFAPSTRPYDLFDPARSSHVKLYVRRVFITDGAELLPSYLRFMRGVVDSEDLPLNISREMLQNNPQVLQMRKALTGRVIGELENLAGKDADAFRKIWDAFGSVIKEGLYEDHERRDALLKLARFTTTAGDGTDARTVCRRSQAKSDRDLLSRGREPGAAQVQSEARSGAQARHRGVAAERSDRFVLDSLAGRFRRQAIQIVEQRRRRFRAHTFAR